MLKVGWSVLTVVFLTACGSVPTLKEIEETKPTPFKAQVDPIQEECGTVPPVPVDLSINMYQYNAGASYHGAPGKYSIIDPEKLKEWRAAKKPLDDWGTKNIKLAHEYLTEGNVNSGRCVVAFIDEWARGNALLGSLKSKDLVGPNQQVNDPLGKTSYYQIMTTIPQVATLYFRVQDLATPEQDARIEWWLLQVEKRLKYFWVVSNDGRNNHLAWSAAGVMQIGILTNNKEDIEYARKAFNEQLSHVDKDGISFMEIKRGKRSFFYHNFLIQALGVMAQMSKLIGEDWWSDPRLQKLISTVADAQIDPDVMKLFEKRTEKQDIYAEWGWYGLLPDNDPRRVRFIQWLKMTPVIANPWTGDPNEKKVLLSKIPFANTLGGDLEVFRDLIEKRGVERNRAFN